jgi:MoaD family protein
MKIKVRVFGGLVQILGRRHSFELDEGATVGFLVGKISEKAGLKRRGYLGHYRISGGDLAILVNGRNIDLLKGTRTMLNDGDEVVILPPAAGG